MSDQKILDWKEVLVVFFFCAVFWFTTRLDRKCLFIWCMARSTSTPPRRRRPAAAPWRRSCRGTECSRPSPGPPGRPSSAWGRRCHGTCASDPERRHSWAPHRCLGRCRPRPAWQRCPAAGSSEWWLKQRDEMNSSPFTLDKHQRTSTSNLNAFCCVSRMEMLHLLAFCKHIYSVPVRALDGNVRFGCLGCLGWAPYLGQLSKCEASKSTFCKLP